MVRDRSATTDSHCTRRRARTNRRMHPREHTIFALSSGQPPCAIAIVRVSGRQAGTALQRLAARLPPARVATRITLREPAQGPIDDAVVLWFPQPASATGEDVAEFHIHGSRAVLRALFSALLRIPGLRLAEPGEFTRRAFENGKIDLTEAEALDDLIHADTDRQRRQALRQLGGLLGDRAKSWRAQIVEASALIEAGIDFADEGDVPAELMAPALRKIAQLREEIEQVLGAEGRSERLRDGMVVAIAGPPNVGKSTLMNQLARREVAIVSPYAGTTRDIIEVQLDLDGFPVTVIDTAGIRDSDDPVEQEGVRRARLRAAAADLVLWLSAGEPAGEPLAADAPVWQVRNKIDLEEFGDGAVAGFGAAAGLASGWAISARRGDGVPQLVDGLVDFAREFFGRSEDALIGRARHRQLLRETAAMLQRSIDAAGAGEELVAEELRGATACLGRLVGLVDVEDVLDVIFREFCVGK